MAEAHDYGVRTLAEQLYVYRGLTQEQAAKELGIGVSTVEGWARSGEWRKKRDDYLKSKSQTLARLVGFRDKILDTLEAEIQPATVHQLLAAYRQTDSMIETKLAGEKGAEIDRPALFLKDLQFVASVLQEADPEGLKILSRSFDLIVSRFKESLAQ